MCVIRGLVDGAIIFTAFILLDFFILQGDSLILDILQQIILVLHSTFYFSLLDSQIISQRATGNLAMAIKLPKEQANIFQLCTFTI